MTKHEIPQNDLYLLLHFFGGVSQLEDEFDIEFIGKDGSWDHKCDIADMSKFKKIGSDRIYQNCWIKFTFNDDHATNGKPKFMNKRIVQGRLKWTT